MESKEAGSEKADKIYDMLVQKDELTWQSIIYDLVRSEQMDAWDINVSLIAQRYIEALRSIRDHDFRISGKVILAAALLLKLQSTKLIGEEIEDLDRMITGTGDFNENAFYDGLDQEEYDADDRPIVFEAPSLTPRTPQPRKRKISVYDLVKALEKALDVKKRRVIRQAPPEIDVPERKRDITLVIKDVYGKITDFFSTNKDYNLTFNSLLVNKEDKLERLYTFLPLLHLSYQRKIDLEQKEHFGDITILPAGTLGTDDYPHELKRKVSKFKKKEVSNPQILSPEAKEDKPKVKKEKVITMQDAQQEPLLQSSSLTQQ